MGLLAEVRKRLVGHATTGTLQDEVSPHVDLDCHRLDGALVGEFDEALLQLLFPEL